VRVPPACIPSYPSHPAPAPHRHGILYSPPASSVARAPVRQLVPPVKMHSFRTHCPHYTPCHCPHPSTHFPDNHSSDSHVVAANQREGGLPPYCGCTTRTAALNVCPSTHDTQLRDDVCLRGGEAIGHRVHAPPQVAPSALSPLHVPFQVTTTASAPSNSAAGAATPASKVPPCRFTLTRGAGDTHV
jgi:hypothetical protein